MSIAPLETASFPLAADLEPPVSMSGRDGLRNMMNDDGILQVHDLDRIVLAGTGRRGSGLARKTWPGVVDRLRV